MALPKDAPELEARLIQAGSALRQTSAALRETAQLVTNFECRQTLKLMADYTNDVSVAVMSS